MSNSEGEATPPVDVEALEKAALRFEGAYLDDNHPWRLMTSDNRAVLEACPQYPYGAYGDAEPKDLKLVWSVLASLKPVCEEIKRLRASSVGPAVDDGVRRLAVEIHRDAHGPGAWARLTDAGRDYYVKRTQEALDRAALTAGGAGDGK